MPRIRTIKPEMAADRKLASISRGARYTFVLLITQADDDGLILGSPRQLLGQLYPHDESVTLAQVSGELQECHRIGLIRWRETKDGAPVLEVCNWSKHQKISHKGKSLILPMLADLSGDTPEGVGRQTRRALAPTMDHGPRTREKNSAPNGAESSSPPREALTAAATPAREARAAARVTNNKPERTGGILARMGIARRDEDAGR